MCGGRSSRQSKRSSATSAFSAVRVVAPCRRRVARARVRPCPNVRRTSCERPTSSRAYGSSSSLCGLKRWPRSGSHGPWARQAVDQARPGARQVAVPDVVGAAGSGKRATHARRRRRTGTARSLARVRENTAKLTRRPGWRPADRRSRRRAGARAWHAGLSLRPQHHGRQRRQHEPDRAALARAQAPARCATAPRCRRCCRRSRVESVLSDLAPASPAGGHADAIAVPRHRREVAAPAPASLPSPPWRTKANTEFARRRGQIQSKPGPRQSSACSAGSRAVQTVLRSRTRPLHAGVRAASAAGASRGSGRGSTRAPARTRCP